MVGSPNQWASNYYDQLFGADTNSAGHKVGTIGSYLATSAIGGEESGVTSFLSRLLSKNAAEGGEDLIRVGRWMSSEEHGAMVDSGMVQEGGGGTTYVAHPADPAAYGSEAAPGSRYVEFNVPRTSLRPAGKEGWAQIPGPNSLYARLAEMRGDPIPQFPPALDLEWLFTK